MQQFRFHLLLFFALFVLAGCGWSNNQVKDDSGKPEVLLAQDCGLDGLKCCATDPACTHGQQCCSDPNGTGKNRCADQCSCGGADEFCCATGQKCQDGLSCQVGSCQACGGVGQPCCQNDQAQACINTSASTTLTCFQSKCVVCGVTNNPCCAGDHCQATSTDARGINECLAGLCVACGGEGQSACIKNDKCLPQNLYNNGSCFACGDANQPCCDSQRCNQAKKLVCELGFCR
ncbi:MAG: hypothetical protein WCK11_03505 [Candidatus Falkowbacteria bacterium]